jgi:hypothetical protein
VGDVVICRNCPGGKQQGKWKGVTKHGEPAVRVPPQLTRSLSAQRAGSLRWRQSSRGDVLGDPVHLGFLGGIPLGDAHDQEAATGVWCRGRSGPPSAGDHKKEETP